VELTRASHTLWEVSGFLSVARFKIKGKLRPNSGRGQGRPEATSPHPVGFLLPPRVSMFALWQRAGHCLGALELPGPHSDSYIGFRVVVRGSPWRVLGSSDPIAHPK
jgi:hypothetical protein